MKVFCSIFIINCLFLLLIDCSFAADKKDITITQKTSIIAESDIKSQQGRFSQSEYSFSVSKECVLFDRMPVNNSIRLKHIDLHNGSGTELPNSLQSKGIYSRFYIPDFITENKNIFIGIDLGFSYDSAGEHDFDPDALRSIYGLSMIYSKGQDIIFLVGVMYRPQSHTESIGFAGFRYKINDRWFLNFLSLNPYISYKINKKAKILLEFDIMSDEFEVLEGYRKGQVLSAYGFGAGVGYEYQINSNLIGKISLGSTFARKFEYYDNGSKTGEKVVPENAFYAQYMLKYDF
jgi:hypothetical protein